MIVTQYDSQRYNLQCRFQSLCCVFSRYLMATSLRLAPSIREGEHRRESVRRGLEAEGGKERVVGRGWEGVRGRCEGGRKRMGWRGREGSREERRARGRLTGVKLCLNPCMKAALVHPNVLIRAMRAGFMATFGILVRKNLGYTDLSDSVDPWLA